MKNTGFFSQGDEEVYSLAYYKKRLQALITLHNNPLEEIEIEEMRRAPGNGCMWCNDLCEFVMDTKESCGKENCKGYDPCNGKNGKCRQLVNTFGSTGRFFRLSKDGLDLLRENQQQ